MKIVIVIFCFLIYSDLLENNWLKNLFDHVQVNDIDIFYLPENFSKLDLEHLYLLIRPKRGHGVNDRLKELLLSPVRF